MRILAVDPGYDRLGIAVLEHTANGSELLLHSACMETDRALELAERIHEIGNEFERLIIEYGPHAVGIESLFFNTNQKTAMGVAQLRGTLLYLARKHGVDIHEFNPQEIKVAVTGYGKSDKQAVADMVKRLIREAPAAGHDDEFDAIAIGITCLAHTKAAGRTGFGG